MHKKLVSIRFQMSSKMNKGVNLEDFTLLIIQ